MIKLFKLLTGAPTVKYLIAAIVVLTAALVIVTGAYLHERDAVARWEQLAQIQSDRLRAASAASMQTGDTARACADKSMRQQEMIRVLGHRMERMTARTSGAQIKLRDAQERQRKINHRMASAEARWQADRATLMADVGNACETALQLFQRRATGESQ